MDWQIPVVILIVLGAGLYLASRILRLFTGKSGNCGGCSSCDTTRNGTHIKPLVTLEQSGNRVQSED